MTNIEREEYYRKVDALIAKHVFGLHDLVSDFNAENGELKPEVWMLPLGGQIHQDNLIKFSQDPRGAELVVNQLRKQGANLNILTTQDGFQVSSGSEIVANASTQALAVCLAAINVKGLAEPTL